MKPNGESSARVAWPDTRYIGFQRDDAPWFPRSAGMAAAGAGADCAATARVDECVFMIGDLVSKWSLEGPLDMQQVRRGDEVDTVLQGSGLSLRSSHCCSARPSTTYVGRSTTRSGTWSSGSTDP